MMMASRKDITIIKVLEPNRFLVHEIPGLIKSPELIKFLELEEILKHFQAFELVSQLLSFPPLNQLVIVKSNIKKKWFRGRVTSLLDTPEGPRIGVFLLDFGQTIIAKLELVRIPNRSVFEVPFQAFEFVLENIQPMSLTFLKDSTLARIPSDKWDTSAKEYVDAIVKDYRSAVIEVNQFSSHSNKKYGQLFIRVFGQEINLNEALTFQKYACFKENQVEENCLPALSPAFSENGRSSSTFFQNGRSSSAFFQNGRSSSDSGVQDIEKKCQTRKVELIYYDKDLPSSTSQKVNVEECNTPNTETRTVERSRGRGRGKSIFEQFNYEMLQPSTRPSLYLEAVSSPD